MSQRRRIPFSNKKKKEQLQQKRQSDVAKQSSHRGSHEFAESSKIVDKSEGAERADQPEIRIGGGPGGRNKNRNRYDLQFFKEDPQELERIKQEGFAPLCPVAGEALELDARYFANYDFPTRPAWDYSLDKRALDNNEHRYFREYVDKLQKRHRKDDRELSLFELNLETWRQLWRVLEFSDILLLIVDVRYASLMFPPALHDHIRHTLKKRCILVLNKIDLVEPAAVVAWRAYFRSRYPDLPVTLFASFVGQHGKKRRRAAPSNEGVHNIFKECRKIVGESMNLAEWETKILEDMQCDEEDTSEDAPQTLEPPAEEEECPPNQPHVLYRHGTLTVGCIGFPNVGKSSLINALKGRKVVSVSHTPGHTKHFQTIYLTNTVRLCDCPGLVFPSSVPKCVQVLFGSFPISQLQVPYRALKYLAERLDLPTLLRLRLPEDYDEWSAVAISDAWAIKCGFMTAKAARPDRYRAANHILRMCLAGQKDLILKFYPPGYEAEKEVWSQHLGIDEVMKYLKTKERPEEVDKDEEPLVEEEGEEICPSSEAEEDGEEDEEEEEQPKARNAFALLNED